MSYKVYYNEVELQEVKEIFWSKDDAHEEIHVRRVNTAYRVDTGLEYESEAEAQKKADEYNAEEEKKPLENLGDSRKEYYVRDDEKIAAELKKSLDKGMFKNIQILKK